MTKFFLTATIILAVSFQFAMCKSKGGTLSTQQYFDSCIVLGYEAVKIANEHRHRADSLQAVLNIYKGIVARYLPKMKVSEPGTFAPSPAPVPDTSKPGDSCGLHGGYNIYIIDGTPKFVRYFRPVMIGSITGFSIHCSIDSVMRVWRNGIYSSKLKPSPRPISDTTIQPRYEYYYKLMIPVNKFGPPLDTINMVLERMGKSMTVDQADELRAIVVRQLNNFIGRPTVDSVKIGGKP